MARLGLSQPNPTLNGPVTALAVNGDQLLIGQNDELVVAAITPDDLTLVRSMAIPHGAIRAITLLEDGTALILSEEGLTALDPNFAVTDFAAGGGYHMSVHGNRVYVAALAAGVRVYIYGDGKITLVGQLLTSYAVEDVAAEGATALWTAEGDGGLRLYDMTSPAKPVVQFESSSYRPTYLVRSSNLHLVVGYGDQLALLDTLNLKAPRLLGNVSLSGSMGAHASDLLMDQTSLLVGRVDVSGPDVLRYGMNASSITAQPTAYGSDGAGAFVARHGDDLFIGSEQNGLRRVQLAESSFIEMGRWPVSAFPSCSAADYLPVNPSPDNLSLLQATDHVTLTWNATCPSGRYRVSINGRLVGTVDQPVLDYALPADQDVFTWQVDALSDAGTAQGSLWTFERGRNGFTAAPATPRLDQVLYVPPPVWLDFSALQTPLGTLALTCIALFGGLLIVIGGAWTVGARAARRREHG